MLTEGPLLYSIYFWILIVLIGFYAYLKIIIYTYWKRHGVPHEPPKVPFGNLLPVILGKISTGNLVKRNYLQFKKYRYHGFYMFHRPLLIINDPELIRQVLIKEFSKFHDRGLYYNEEVDPLSGHLFLLPGEKWKKLRTKLTPTFTAGKLKQMFPLIKEIGDELVKVCDKAIAEDNIIECKTLVVRYTTDSISSTAFGFNCKSLDNAENDFIRYGEMIFDQNPIRNIIGVFVPIVFDILHISLLRREIINFFSKSFQDMVKYRQQNKIVRNDFLNLLIQLMDKGVLADDEKSNEDDIKSSDDKNKITMVQAQAHAFSFFVAGFETSSSTVTYLLYELALNPDIQEKVHTEIDEFCAKGEMTYDRIMNELDYLHMALNETLRKHPSVPLLNRLCVEDWTIPDSNFTIKKGSGIMISVTGLHGDPNIFPDPEKFDPNRFSKENIASRSPYVYLPFGDGPRVCIGARFAILQSTIALIALLSNYKFYTCEKTPIPIHYSKRSFTQSPDGGVYLRMEKRIK